MYGTIRAAGIFFLESRDGEQALTIIMGFASFVFFLVSLAANLILPFLFLNLTIMFFLLAGGMNNETCAKVAGYWGVWASIIGESNLLLSQLTAASSSRLPASQRSTLGLPSCFATCGAWMCYPSSSPSPIWPRSACGESAGRLCTTFCLILANFASYPPCRFPRAVADPHTGDVEDGGLKKGRLA